MSIAASKSNQAFFDSDIHGKLPDDAVEISREYHAALLAAQSAGQIISWDGDLPVAIDPPPPSFEEEVAMFKHAIQQHMDAAAKIAGYDDIKTAVTYAEEPSVPKFQEEGRAFRAWRSQVWAYGYEQLALVAAGGRTKPTVAELVAELPKLALHPEADPVPVETTQPEGEASEPVEVPAETPEPATEDGEPVPTTDEPVPAESAGEAATPDTPAEAVPVASEPEPDAVDTATEVAPE